MFCDRLRNLVLAELAEPSDGRFFAELLHLHVALDLVFLFARQESLNFEDLNEIRDSAGLAGRGGRATGRAHTLDGGTSPTQLSPHLLLQSMDEKNTQKPPSYAYLQLREEFVVLTPRGGIATIHVGLESLGA